jgi:hypothetical protein
MGGGKSSGGGGTGGYAGRRFLVEQGSAPQQAQSKKFTSSGGEGGGSNPSNSTSSSAPATAGTASIGMSDKQMADILGGMVKGGALGILNPTTTLLGAAYGAWDRYNKQQKEQQAPPGTRRIGPTQTKKSLSLLGDEDDEGSGLGSRGTSSDFGDRESSPGGMGGV